MSIIESIGVPSSHATSDLRTLLAAKAPDPLEHLGPMDDATASIEVAKTFLTSDRWEWGGESLAIKPPLVWEGYSRSFGFRLHAWEPIRRLAVAFDATNERIYFDYLLRLSMDWLKSYQTTALEHRTFQSIEDFIADAEGPAWYDMSIALRTYRLAWLCQRAASQSTVSDAAFGLMIRGAYFHLIALSSESHFQAHNNHGLYQALSLLAAARRLAALPDMGRFRDLARRRLQAVLGHQISPGGVSLEHSPAYHQMILGTLLGAKASGLLNELPDPPDLGRMQEALSWMVAPDLTLAPIGDTDPLLVGNHLPMGGAIEASGLAWQMARGSAGEPPLQGVRGYLPEGYAFARRQPPGEADPRRASYLAQIAGFHSRTHKHADHGSFIWHDRGRYILTDPGKWDYSERVDPGSDLARKGYWYADARRIYVERTRSHNCVEVDGEDHPRAGAKPFGSALIYAGEQRSLIVSECDIRLSADIRQRRILVLKPGQFLLVIDRLQDRAGESHTWRQWFKFAPIWGVCRAGLGYTAEDCLAPGETLQVRSLVTGIETLPVVRGQTEPDLAGWASTGSRRLSPAARIGFELAGSSDATFCTLFSFGTELELGEQQQLSPSLTTARLGWKSDGRIQRIELRRGEGKPTRAIDLAI